MNKDLTSKRTPLRNSSLANRPFRSPFASITPKCDIKQTPPLITSTTTPTTADQNSTPKRSLPFPGKPQIKKRRIEIEVLENRENKRIEVPSKTQLLILKKRIRSKRQEVESLKSQLACRKKHNREDVRKEIDRWRGACQTALVQFQRDWNETNGDGIHYDMRRILTMLNIPEEIVKFPDEFDLV
ncbi:uncharacterized protein [Fopius arisanus]|uniref:Sfr1_0 protein n=1 Tax=Fopius arisanus TaxID=64838 RepID=A0A0C9R6U2_9HYME|nr:PREDICTED: uncharacterized protein LOC105265464 [Fopius arisanus]